jgi:hypothetical protein
MPEHQRGGPPRASHVILPIALLPGQNLHERPDVAGMMSMRFMGRFMGLGGCRQADRACHQQGEQQWPLHEVASRFAALYAVSRELCRSFLECNLSAVFIWHSLVEE